MMRTETDYSLKSHNTFGIDARCARFIEFGSVAEATEMLPSVAKAPYIIIGGGSNLLFTKDYGGTVVRSAIRGKEATLADGDVLLRCGSGERWDDVVAYCVEHGWHGTENLSLIPGDVGASAVQNIGAYGAEIADMLETVEAVEVATGQRVTIAKDDCGYGYRQSRFKQDWLGRFFITHVTYRLSRTFAPRLDYGNIREALAQRGIGQPTASELRETIIGIRRRKLPDPKLVGNAGSFFVNPMISPEKYADLLGAFPDIPSHRAADGQVKIAAGWLIEQCGWKGKSLGRVGVHDRQALVLVNRGGATGEDILRLCRQIQHDVRERFGIELKPEVNVL